MEQKGISVNDVKIAEVSLSEVRACQCQSVNYMSTLYFPSLAHLIITSEVT